MTTLIADRFLRLADQRAIDLATGEIVAIRVSRAKGRAEQQAWIEACAAMLGIPKARTLIDFGLLGCTDRFEAYRVTRVQLLPQTIANISIPRQVVGQAVEWLEEPARGSPRILYASAAGRGWLEPLAREIRLRGFIPLNLSLLSHGGARLHPNAQSLLSGRAVVLIDEHHECSDGALSSILSSAFITLLNAKAREIAAIVHVPSKERRVLCLHCWSDRAAPRPAISRRRPFIARASESRGAYGQARGVPLTVDSRALTLLEEAHRWVSRGRHSAAERALRAAIAAFDRRKDLLHAGDAGVQLGRLLIDRGRASEARSHFTAARDRFQQLGAINLAVRACAFAGLAQTDEGALEDAEGILRAAYSAASALHDADAIQLAGVALARNMYWRARHADALALLAQVAIDQPGGARYWCLMSRLRLATGNLDSASHSLSHAREAQSTDASTEVIIRLAHARIQARLGDIEALGCHVRAGVEAARTAHLPLAGLKLRLALIEGLLNAGQLSRARAIGGRTKMLARTPLPALFKQHVERVARRLARGECGVVDQALVSAAHETAACFPSGHIDRVTELLSVCHDVEDERAALTAAAVSVRKQTGALAAGIFGASGADPAPFGISGVIASGAAKRCIELTYAIQPDRGLSGIEAAVPIHHLGQTIGAIACRWSVEGPGNAGDALGFMRLAAAACAPLVQIVLTRDSVQLPQTASEGLELLGSSPGIEDVRRLIARAANAPFTVLVEGESGTGKELVARAIHRTGRRRDRPFCALNCAALTEELVDAELFGHVKGAFTGAATDRLGLFESADQGTVFLDEVGELSARAQAKLLRVLQEGEIRRIGENFTRPIDARLVAATNRPLQAEAEAGRFRRDLLYRLDVIRIAVPPLRERVDDVPLLAARFWRQAVERIGSKAVLGPAALAALARYDWPGNVRELQNVLTALAVSVPPRGIVSAAAMPAAIAHLPRAGSRETLGTARRHFEERFVRAALAQSAGHRGQTAAALGVSRQGLAKLMQRLQI